MKKTDMKKKLLCALVIMTCLFSGNTINAQDVKRLIPTNNVIKVNYGPGFVYSTIIDYYERKEYHTSMSLDLSVDYAHTFNKGLGFGINVIQLLDLTTSMVVPAYIMVILRIRAGM